MSRVSFRALRALHQWCQREGLARDLPNSCTKESVDREKVLPEKRKKLYGVESSGPWPCLRLHGSQVHHPTLILALQETEGPLQAFNTSDDRCCWLLEKLELTGLVTRTWSNGPHRPGSAPKRESILGLSYSERKEQL